MRRQWAVPVLASILILSLGLQPLPASAAVIDLDWSVAARDQGTITINQGDTVTWTWADTRLHSVATVAGPESFDSGLLSGVGTTFSHTFNQAGTYSIQCGIHSSMVVEIIVNEKESCDALDKAETKGNGNHKGISKAKANNNCD